MFMEVDKEALVEGANTMLKIAMHLLEKMKDKKDGNLLEDEVDGDPEDWTAYDLQKLEKKLLLFFGFLDLALAWLL